jgi:hypothetical protein
VGSTADCRLPTAACRRPTPDRRVITSGAISAGISVGQAPKSVDVGADITAGDPGNDNGHRDASSGVT